MTVIVKVVSAANGSRTPHDDRWIVEWNPHVAAGVLEVTSTKNRSKAKRFSSMLEAHNEWHTVSEIEPTRPWDNHPNRPLTGIHIIIERLADA